MIKGLVISAAVVVGLAGLADRGLAVVAGNAVGEAIARSEGLAEDPDVTFRGFPFLTQAVGGEFEQVDIDARDVRLGELTFSRVTAELKGVEVGISDALSGEVQAVPVGSGTASIRLDYADLNAFLQRKPGAPQASPGSGFVIVRSTVGVPGRGSVPVEGKGTPSVADGAVTVTVSDVRASSGPALPAAVARAAAGRLSFSVSTRGLPFGIVVRDVAVEPEGLRFTATADGVVVRAR